MAGKFFKFFRLLGSARSWRIAAGAMATIFSTRHFREGDSLEKIAAPWEVERQAVAARLLPGDLSIPLALAGLPIFFYPLFPRRCLRRSLTLYRHLIRVGHDPELVIGVKKAGNGLRGHAWVRLDGKPVWENLAELPTYTVSMILHRGRVTAGE